MGATFTEIATAAAPYGTSALILSILAWKSPQLVKEFFAGVRGLLNDMRKPRQGRRGKVKT